MSALLARSSQDVGLATEAVHRQCHRALAMLHTALQDKIIRPKHILYVALAGLTSVWLALNFISRFRNRTRQSTTRPSTPNLEKRSMFKAADREPGGMLYAHLSLLPEHCKYLLLTLTCPQYGFHPLFVDQALSLAPHGLRFPQNRFPIAPSATDRSTTLPWVCVACSGTTG